MADFNQTTDILTPPLEKPKLPGNLNVLTILTFIGCGVGALFTLAMPALMKFLLNMMNKAAENGQLTEKQATDIEKGRIGMQKFLDNQWSLLLIGMVGIALCLYGALRMRKLKKEGYYIYIIGELAPIIASTVLLGFSVQFNGVMSYILGLGIPVLFIILYSANSKYLK